MPIKKFITHDEFDHLIEIVYNQRDEIRSLQETVDYLQYQIQELKEEKKDAR